MIVFRLAHGFKSFNKVKFYFVLSNWRLNINYLVKYIIYDIAINYIKLRLNS